MVIRVPPLYSSVGEVARRLNFEVVLKAGWYLFLRQVPGIGREGISVILRIARVSSSSRLSILYLQVGVVQGHRVGNIFHLSRFSVNYIYV